MSPETTKPVEAYKAMLLLASAVVVVSGLHLARNFFIPVSLAFFLAAVSFPIMNWLREHKVPRIFAVLITVLVVFAFLTGFIIGAAMLINDLSEGDRLETYGRKLYGVALDTGAKLEEWQVENAQEEIKKFLTADKIVDFFKGNITSLLARVFDTFQVSFIVLILLVFMLGEARIFSRRFEAIVEARGPNLQRMLSATRDIQKYLGIKTLISIATGVLAGLLCWAAELDFPLLWGLLAFALNYIPAVGSIIAGVPPMLLALLTHDVRHAIAVACGYLVINGFLGNFMEPALLGRRFGLSTVVIVISVLFWGFLWGPVGMLLAVPLTMMIKVALDNTYELRWLGVAISQGKKDTEEQERRIIKESAKQKEASVDKVQVDKVDGAEVVPATGEGS
ncbi:AI-2E family transporter [Verrucomicrobiaceae bacterium N1E253]|uniref:AI-2E family transporter n=1 Tax=Oceaniferula marina TaxID=2748318 RepID=A0A851GB90_9BACT|nr:AI-2E family transporter [Oceaniferula marina]NWK54686.1 AI-2E family transporter [Oceaniferula marina]